MIKNYHDTWLIIHINFFIKTSKASEAEKYCNVCNELLIQGTTVSSNTQHKTIINNGESDASIRKTKSRKAPQNMPAIPDIINEC